MSERFNSGIGGYTCDCCAVLLWAGFKGLTNEHARCYCYGDKQFFIIEKNLAFCSESCRNKQLGKEIPK